MVTGQTVKVRQIGGLDGLIHILTAGQCGGGTNCVASTDSGEATGITYTALADGPVYIVVESWGNPSASTTFDVRIDRYQCGNGVIEAAETCDDGNTNAGDGCSATCTLQTGFACDAGSPSVCYDVSACGTNTACYLGPCTGTVVTGSATGLPANIPDNLPAGGVNLTVPIAATGTIQKMVVRFGATHTWDSDIDMFLTGPAGGTELDVCTDNGSTADNFVNTFIRDGVSAALSTGTAPFTGVYRPDAAFSAFTGQSVTGNWVFRVADDGSGDTGAVNTLDMAFCVTP
ncbi:MAG: DUF4215 domain-containing protein [Polyangiaceae bacterium]|nr:DUF4215 domain-containing protein [Polyangiaceae bacterium]